MYRINVWYEIIYIGSNSIRNTNGALNSLDHVFVVFFSHLACCNALWDCVLYTEGTTCICIWILVFFLDNDFVQDDSVCNSHIVDSAKRNWHKWSWLGRKTGTPQLHKHRMDIQKKYLIVKINILITLWQYNRFKKH